MSIVWKYKIELKDEKVFCEIEKERNIKIPNELKKFIIEANAATPVKHCFDLQGTEKVFGSVLSFNRKEADTDSVFVALEVIKDKELLPFAIDPFGNYICYNLKTNTIDFWEHEVAKVYATKYKLEEFIDSLY